MTKFQEISTISLAHSEPQINTRPSFQSSVRLNVTSLALCSKHDIATNTTMHHSIFVGWEARVLNLWPALKA